MKNQLHKRLEAYKVQEWKKRELAAAGRRTSSPETAPWWLTELKERGICWKRRNEVGKGNTTQGTTRKIKSFISHRYSRRKTNSPAPEKEEAAAPSKATDRTRASWICGGEERWNAKEKAFWRGRAEWWSVRKKKMEKMVKGGSVAFSEEGGSRICC